MISPSAVSRDKVKLYQYFSLPDSLTACSREWQIIDDVSVPGEIKAPSLISVGTAEPELMRGEGTAEPITSTGLPLLVTL